MTDSLWVAALALHAAWFLVLLVSAYMFFWKYRR